MTAATLLGIGALGGLGALLRFGVSLFVATHTGRLWLGTLAVNLSGSFTLGLLGPSRLVGTGLLGAFTTFSAWMYETRVLSEGKRSREAIAVLGLSLALGLVAIWLGRKLG